MFLLVTTAYILCLALWRPRPISLKTQLPGYWENIKSIKATLILGLILICVFWLTSGLEFKESKSGALSILGTSEKGVTQLNAYFQIVTHIFVHINLKHLISNLVGLFYLSHYERRVGSGRYLMVFILSGIFSSLMAMPFHHDAVAAGASAGIFGLGAAYFTDHKNLSRREWINLVLISAFFGIIFALPDKHMQDIKIDHWGHFFGAVSGIILCRLFLIPETKKEIRRRKRWRIATIIIIPIFLIFSLGV